MSGGSVGVAEAAWVGVIEGSGVKVVEAVGVVVAGEVYVGSMGGKVVDAGTFPQAATRHAKTTPILPSVFDFRKNIVFIRTTFRKPLQMIGPVPLM